MAAEVGSAVVSGVASKVAESVFDPIRREIRYVFKYQSYIDDLKNTIEELRNKRQMVGEPVKNAERQGEEIFEAVKKWLRDVDEFTEQIAKSITEDEDKANKHCFKWSCPNLNKRYMLGKNAVKATEEGTSLLGRGNFSSVSYRPMLQRTESLYVSDDYEPFDSRISKFEEIMEALKDANANMIGVYGMGGVGKTTLVKKVAWQAKEDKLFDELVFAEVTQTPDVEKIQGEIAEQLGLEFKEESVSGRACRLRDRLKKEKRILIILDNIWKRIDLKDIGIPFGFNKEESLQLKEGQKECNNDRMRCTILLTSRNQDVLCNHMNTEKNISVGPLSDDDARNLFQKIVGVLDNSDFRPIVDEIVEKCEGLPIAITVIANALKEKRISIWRDSLAKLRMSNPRCVPDMNDTLYSTIELSCTLLNSEEARSLLLLCGLFHAGKNISTFYLLIYGMGLGLFEDVYTLNDGWNRVHSLINNLQASCLLESDTNNNVKMHDIIHAVVVTIAKEKLMFNIPSAGRLKEKLMSIHKDSVAISLHSKDIDRLPEKMDFPELELFTLFSEDARSLQIPDIFFEGTKELKVLGLTRIHLLPIPSSVLCLTNLQTLCLEDCLLGDITMIGELRNLEILSFSGSDIEQLPERIRQLTLLRLLKLSNCLKLKVIPPNVISSLSHLEELYIDNSFVKWEAEGQSNASLVELKELSRLNSIYLHIPDAHQIIQQHFIPENLEKYGIFIGDVWDWSRKCETSRTLKLKVNNNIQMRYDIKMLLKRAEDLHLDDLDGIKNTLYELDREGFPQLKHLHVQNSIGLLYIVDSMGCFPLKIAFPMLESLFLCKLINLEKILHGQLEAESFNKLRIIKIEKCDRLKCLFSSSMAKNLTQLQEMKVTDCKNLREIFNKESEENRVHEIGSNCQIEFTQLRTLTLQSLPQFISFGFNMEVLLPRLENLTLSSINIENVWLDQHPAVSSYSQSLKSLTVEDCNGLKFLFSSSTTKNLMQLQKLVIVNCNSMEAVIATKELGGEESIIDTSFPKLFYLKLKGLPKLTRFGTGNLVEFLSLNELHIESCSSLRTFFADPSCADMVKNESEELNLEKSLADINPLFDEKVAFPSLEKMRLLHLDNLQLIWHNHLHADSFCKLKVVTVEFCEKLTTIVPSNSRGLKFENLEILTITYCWGIKSLFPVSIATRLMQLKYLHISCCGLEEIVAKEDVEGPLRFVFHQLLALILTYLPKLKYFYRGLHTTEWPVLHWLMVINCNKLKVYDSEFPSFQKTDGESQPALFVFEKVINDLEILGWSDDSIASICLDLIPAKSLCKLKELWLFNFDEESKAFLFGFFQRLYRLKAFSVWSSSFKELFPYEGHIWKQDSQIDSCLQDLQHLEVRNCNHLKSLNMSSSTSFTNLTTLIVWYCDGLESIFVRSTVKRLVQLKEMKITECKLLAEVIANEIDRREEEMVFCQLKVLELHCLSSLTCFCSTNYDFKFSCLEQVIVSECPKLTIFSRGLLSTPKLKRVQLTPEKQEERDEEIDEQYFWKDDLNSTIQQMFTDMIGFRYLEHLKLSEFPTLKEKIWNDQVPVGLFRNLKRLVVNEFLDISSAIQSNMLCHFKNLETLEVRSCDSLCQVFDIEGQLNDDGHTLGQSHQQILGFNNLKSLKVHNCHNLRYIFTPSIILGLVQLQEIEIANCALIEEIITKEGEKDAVIDKIIIRQLNTICLESLPNLTSLYSGSKILEFPPLEIIIIKDCQKIHLRDFNLHLASLFTKEVVLPTLDDLTLSSISTEHSQLPAVSSYFENLTNLIIHGCDHLKYLFSSSMIKNLVQLEELEICNCNFIEEIIVEEEEKSNMLFPKLKKLNLLNLQRLTRFCNSTGDFLELPFLSELWFNNCPSMKTFISNSICGDMTSREINSEENFYTHMIQPLFDKKVRLPSLEILWIHRMDELWKIWDDQLSLESFCKLKTFSVDICNKLVNIFPCNMFGIHKKLENFYVENCDLVEEIFQVVEKSCCEGVVKEEGVPRFVFSELTWLTLKNLPSLKGLYLGTHISQWPVLKQLNVYGCDKVEIFASEFLSFQRTHGEIQDEIIVQQPLFSVDKDAFPRLEKLLLHKLPELLHMWRENSRPSNIFQNLKTLTVSKCGNLEILLSSSLSCQNLMSLQVFECDGLRYLLTLSKAKTLVHLTSMNVSDCKMMEQIIINSRSEVEDSIVFSKLDILELHYLPSLTSFCCGDFTLEFPSLEKVTITQCLKMETFSHGVLSTPKLQRLQLTQGEDEVEESWEGNLNSSVQHLFKNQSGILMIFK